jgi:hypothetical protein
MIDNTDLTAARHHRSRRRQKGCDPMADGKAQPTG